MIALLHNWNPLHVADRWLCYLRYGRGVQFSEPTAAALQAALRKLNRYGVRTYAYTFGPDGARQFRVRSAQAEWARYLLEGGTPSRAWMDANPRAQARAVGWAGAVLGAFMGRGK